MSEKQDVANALRAQFGKHARIDKIEQSSRAQMTFERGETKKRSEEKKWSEGEYGHYDKSRPKHRINIQIDGDHPWWLSVGEGLLEATEYDVYSNPKSKHVACRVVAEDYKKHTCAGCGIDVFQDVHHADRPTWICRVCRLKSGLFHDSEVRERNEYRRNVNSFTKRGLGGMELRNENLGGFMAGHGDPVFVDSLRKSGQLQVRMDERGHPTEYLVSGSRKQQSEQLKNFNDAQKRAEDRGWRGTYSHGKHDVKRLRHGGLTPDR